MMARNPYAASNPLPANIAASTTPHNSTVLNKRRPRTFALEGAGTWAGVGGRSDAALRISSDMPGGQDRSDRNGDVQSCFCFVLSAGLGAFGYCPRDRG